MKKEQTQLICPYCGKETPKNGVRCVHCGGAFRACGACGAVNKSEQEYCTKCGAPLYAAGQRPVPQPCVQPPQQTVPQGGQPVAGQAAGASAGPQEEKPEKYQFLLDIWQKNRRVEGLIYKVANVTNIVAHILLLVFLFAAYAAWGQIESAGPFSVYPTLAVVFLVFFILFALLRSATQIVCNLYATAACGRWIKEDNIDGIAILLDDLRQSLTFSTRWTKFKFNRGRDAVYLLTVPGRRGRYVAGSILMEIAALLWCAFLCACLITVLIYGSLTFQLLSAYLPIVIVAGIALIVTIVAVVFWRRGSGGKQDWLREIWSARTGFPLPEKAKRR